MEMENQKAVIQAAISKLTETCFDKCVQTPGNKLDSSQANCIDSTAPAEHVFAKEVQKLQAEQFKPMEQLTLEPYERDHCVVVACYRPAKKQKTS